MNSKKIKLVLFFLFFICVSTLLHAQPVDPGGGPGGGDPPVGAGVPLDGGALSLLIAGAIYGVKQLKKKKQAE